VVVVQRHFSRVMWAEVGEDLVVFLIINLEAEAEDGFTLIIFSISLLSFIIHSNLHLTLCTMVEVEEGMLCLRMVAVVASINNG
jgi:hypothetical protein